MDCRECSERVEIWKKKNRKDKLVGYCCSVELECQDNQGRSPIYLHLIPHEAITKPCPIHAESDEDE